MVFYRATYVFLYLSLQNCRTFSLLNAVPGSVLIRCGIPCCAIYTAKNFKTLSVVGLVRNSASGHPDHPGILSAETKIKFSLLGAFWKKPARCNECSSFSFSTLGSVPNSFWLLRPFLFLPAVMQSGQLLSFSTISLCIRGHQTSTATLSMASLLACQKRKRY